MLLALSSNGKTAHRLECRHARITVNTLGLSRLDLMIVTAENGAKECTVCKPFVKCKVLGCQEGRERGKGFCLPHIL